MKFIPTDIDENVAVTDFAAVIETVHVVVVPVHAPDQLVNLYPEAGEAVNTTEVPLLKLAEVRLQVVPQFIPAGELVTVPPAETDLDRVNRYCVTTEKVAVTDLSAVIDRTQVAPVQAPDHPLKA
jgi:hypothetical protein